MSKRGQSLVEMALLTPLLLAMFLGLIEVGWALWDYATLASSTREAARFLARAMYSDEAGHQHFLDTWNVSHHAVRMDNHGEIYYIPGRQYDGTVIITHFVVNPGNPYITEDDAYTYTVSTYGPAIESRIDITQTVSDALSTGDEINRSLFARIYSEISSDCQARSLNCDKMSQMLDHPEQDQEEWRFERIVVVEAIYGHPQLLNFFGDKRLPMYTHTAMRVSSSRRPS